jgi:glucose-1-phosphatase
MQPQFLYFDMGNVVLRFWHERQAEQMAQVAGIPARQAWQILFEDGLEWAYERGELTREQFYARFCEQSGTWPDIDALDYAGSDIFELNVPLVGLLGQLAYTGFRLGLLSNTSPSHWQHCTSRFAILTKLFRLHALSFRLRATKPDPRIYAAAAEMAGVAPQRLFFTDDRPEHVAAARAALWDGVVFQSTSQINEELRSRGVALNY